MLTNTPQENDDDFEAVIEKIRQHELAEQQAATQEASTSEQQTKEATEDAGKDAQTEGEGAQAAEAPAAPVEKQGDVRNALRASRRAERQAREETARLKAELEETRKQIPAPKDDGVPDAELAELEADMPLVAKALKETRALKASLPKASAPAAPAKNDEPEFIPPVQPAHVQDAIDEIPDLLDMQSNPDQSAFNLAVQTDALLRASPKWADKPMTERLAECARRVKAELGTGAPAPAPQPPAPPAPARRTAAAAVAEAPRAKPSTLSDIAGGAAPTTEGAPSLEQIMAMSPEDMERALARFG